MRNQKVKKNILFIIVLFALSGKFSFANNLIASDSMEVITQYSLFSEYHKNHDYASALPFGFKVLAMNPVKFSKWIYYKMEDILWYLHDSSSASPELAKEYTDSMLSVYNLAMIHFEKDKAYFQLRKAFITEIWAKAAAENSIAEYVKAIELNPDVSSYYYNRLGSLYKNNASDSNDYKNKAIDLYSYLSEKEPDNSQWNTELESLVENIEQRIEITKKAWDLNPDDLAKGWKYASLCLRANEYPKAIEALEILTQKAPATINYWMQLASLYYKTEQLDKSIDAYKKLLELDSGNKDHYLNLGIAYRDKGNSSAARTNFLKAHEVGNNWALPIYYEGFLYESAARSCGFEFMDKCVYQLAVDTYRRALSFDSNLSQARDRVSALQSSIPTKEDYFFRNHKKGDVIKITGECYNWIGKSITVP